jgi:hypothetical protein
MRVLHEEIWGRSARTQLRRAEETQRPPRLSVSEEHVHGLAKLTYLRASDLSR